MDITRVLRMLDKLAPLKLAAKWDNVGLLVEPSAPHIINNILLTNDLTLEVMQEAIAWKSDMIISYHPPIFQPIKRITNQHWKQQLIIKALENRIAIYSPHTACDAVCNGVNDWLAKGLGQIEKLEPIDRAMNKFPHNLVKLVLENSDGNASKSLQRLKEEFDNVVVKPFTGGFEVEIVCKASDLANTINVASFLPFSDIKVLELCSQPIADTGTGRMCYLKRPTRLVDLIENIKQYLSLDNVRLAVGVGCDKNTEISTVALCAGSGASVLKGAAADVYLTGEMSHHEILDAVSNKTSVILCEHSNTERGYLNEFQRLLLNSLEDVLEVRVSEVDRDPLVVC